MVCPVLANQDFARKPILRTYFFCQSRFWAVFCSSQLLNQMFQSSLFSCSWPKVPPLTVASLGLVKGVTQTSSQSKAHSLDSTPPKSSSSIMPPLECRDFQKNSLFFNIWNWFLERGSRASQVPGRDAPGGPGL